MMIYRLYIRWVLTLAAVLIVYAPLKSQSTAGLPDNGIFLHEDITNPQLPSSGGLSGESPMLRGFGGGGGGFDEGGENENDNGYNDSPLPVKEDILFILLLTTGYAGFLFLRNRKSLTK